MVISSFKLVDHYHYTVPITIIIRNSLAPRFKNIVFILVHKGAKNY